MWPRLASVAVPRYKGSGHSGLFRDQGDRPESLPDLFTLPGHVLYGWRDTKRKSEQWVQHSEDVRKGHTHDSEREKASKFPADWSHQFIVDAVRDAIEFPEDGYAREMSRTVFREVDGIWIEARCTVKNGRALNVEAYPVEQPKIPKKYRR